MLHSAGEMRCAIAALVFTAYLLAPGGARAQSVPTVIIQAHALAREIGQDEDRCANKKKYEERLNALEEQFAHRDLDTFGQANSNDFEKTIDRIYTRLRCGEKKSSSPPFESHYEVIFGGLATPPPPPPPAERSSLLVLVGEGTACAFQKFHKAFSDSVQDPLTIEEREDCKDPFFGGLSFGVPLSSAANPWIQADKKSPHPIVFGLEATFLGGAGSVTFQGTPVPLPPPTDTYKITTNFLFLVNGTATVPVSDAVALIGRGGLAVANTTATYNCVGYCAVAGVATFSQSDNVWAVGGDIGGGVQYAIPGSQIKLEADVTEVFLANRNVAFGQPSTIYTSSDIHQNITLFTVGARIPISALVGGPPPAPAKPILTK